MFLFRAIGNLFKTLGLLLTGRINEISAVWSRNPTVAGAKFDVVIAEKEKAINTAKGAIGKKLAIIEQKAEKLKETHDEIEEYTAFEQGAKAAAKEAIQAVRQANPGVTDPAELQALCAKDSEYVSHRQAALDFGSTLNEKEKLAVELENEIAEAEEEMADYEAQIKSELRALESLREEKHDTQADLALAKQEQEANDALSGIKSSNASEMLAEVRQARREAKADAKVSKRLSGMDDKRDREKYLQKARTSVAATEFDAEFFGAVATDSASTSTPEKLSVPEE